MRMKTDPREREKAVQNHLYGMRSAPNRGGFLCLKRICTAGICSCIFSCKMNFHISVK